MSVLRVFALILLVTGLAGCGSQVKRYDGPEITHVFIKKSDRRMYLLHDGKVQTSYPIDLGFAPEGHKEFEGDGRTPEGHYVINRRNPDSAFFLSLGISYPNSQDAARAYAAGKSPGGDIFIHGQPNQKPRGNGPDWTAGCISVSNKAIAQIYLMVKNGTPITIRP